MKRRRRIMNMIPAFCILGLLPFVHTAFAEDGSIFSGDWEQAGQEAAAAGLEGSFVSLDHVDLQMWVPSFMVEDQLTDFDRESGLIGVYVDPSGGGACFVSYRDEDGYSLDDYADYLKQTGSVHEEKHVLNGIEAVGRRDGEDDFAAVTVATEDGFFVEFSYTDWGDDRFRNVAGYMISSIQTEEGSTEDGEDHAILSDGTYEEEEYQPQTEEPETQPGAEEPETQPGAEEPESQPGTEEPETQPGAEEPESQPGAEEPETQPGAEEPETQPAAEEPETQPGAEESGTHSPAKSGDTWTFLMYFCGADLESDMGYATDNIREMIGAGTGDNIHIVIETGGAYEWQSSQIGSDEIGRYAVEDGNLVKVDSLPDTSMGDPEALADFISFGKEKYPADKTALILWDHGGGVLGGVCYDQRYSDDALTVPELKQVFSDDRGLEFVGFDTCITATLEYAEAVENSADYMIASQENEPGAGWDYGSFLGYISENPTVDGEKLGKVIVDSYYDKCDRDGLADSVTLSVIDLAKTPGVSRAFGGYTDELVGITNDSRKMADYSQEAEQAESFGGRSIFEGYSDMADLKGLADCTGDFTPGSYQQLSASVDEAVLYSRAGSARSGASGLSVFYPYYLDDEVYGIYSDISDNESYLQYLSVVNGTAESFDWDDIYDGDIGSLLPVDPDNYSVTSEVSQDGDGNYVLTVTSGADTVSSVKYDVAKYDEDTGHYLFLGADDELEADYGNGIFTEHFNGQWLMIGDIPVCALLTEKTEVYNLYSVPAKINGDLMVIKAEYLWDEERFQILGADGLYDMSTWMSERTSVNLQPGDEVEFVSAEFDPEALDFDMREQSLGTVTWRDDTEMTMGRFESGNYLYVFQIEDIFGNIYFSTPIWEDN